MGSLLFRERPFIEGFRSGTKTPVGFMSLLFREQPFIEGMTVGVGSGAGLLSLLFREQPFIEGPFSAFGRRCGAGSLLFREQPFIKGAIIHLILSGQLFRHCSLGSNLSLRSIFSGRELGGFLRCPA